MPKSRQRRSSKKQRKSRPRRLRGGDSASYAAQVYGPLPHQAVAGSNVIAMQNPSGFAQTQAVMVGGSAVPAVVANAGEPVVANAVQVAGYVHPHVANLTPVVAGGSVAGYVTQRVGELTPFSGGRRRKRGGAALLDDIAIPALFLTANQMYGSRRSRNTKKRTRFSRKVR